MTMAPQIVDRIATTALCAWTFWFVLNFNETVLWKLALSVVEAL